ncbi:MAG: hypothetical protein ACUVQY_11365 [Thermoproteota archaeon]
MRVKIEIEASDGSMVTVFDESVAKEWQLSQLTVILKTAYYLEEVISDYVNKMPEEGKMKAEGVENRE